MYSKDLRKKVINFLGKGNTQRKTAEIFGINKATVNSWYQRYKKEGHFSSRKMRGAKPSINEQEFIKFVESRSDLKVSDIRERFKLSHGGACYWLKKLGFVLKKKSSITWKQRKKKDKNI